LPQRFWLIIRIRQGGRADRDRMIRFLVVLAFAGLLAASGSDDARAAAATPSETSAQPPAAANGETAHVDGFRSAKWGMIEAEARTAVTNDFKIPADKLKAEPNPNERTTVLTIQVPDLIDGAGIARVSYIFGYTTKKLIQVNVVWGTPVDPQAKPEGIVAAANQLRDLFMGSGYEPGTIVANARANDGEVIVFEGQDADKHTTLLRLVAGQPAADKDAKKEKPAAVTALFLSYILDSRNPDIYRLKKGQF
jgi:hypothetical protein